MEMEWNAATCAMCGATIRQGERRYISVLIEEMDEGEAGRLLEGREVGRMDGCVAHGREEFFTYVEAQVAPLRDVSDRRWPAATCALCGAAIAQGVPRYVCVLAGDEEDEGQDRRLEGCEAHGQEALVAYAESQAAS